MSIVENQINTLIKEEREFIHDLATPLMIAMGMVESTIGKMADEDPLREKLTKASNALGKMNTILKTRRENLIQSMADNN